MQTPERAMMKSYMISAVLLLAAAGTAFAAPTALYSGSTGIKSYLSDDGTKTMYVNILYAVYDTSTGAYDGAPGSQRYVYVYLLESQSNSQIAVDLFSVVAPLNSIAGVGTIETTGGIDAIASIGGTLGVSSSADFAFSIFGQSLDPGKSSYILVYTSDYTFRKDGTPIVKGGSQPTSDDGLPVPDGDSNGDPIPEPMTAVMLGFGGLALLKSRASAKRQ